MLSKFFLLLFKIVIHHPLLPRLMQRDMDPGIEGCLGLSNFSWMVRSRRLPVSYNVFIKLGGQFSFSLYLTQEMFLTVGFSAGTFASPYIWDCTWWYLRASCIAARKCAWSCIQTWFQAPSYAVPLPNLFTAWLVVKYSIGPLHAVQLVAQSSNVSPAFWMAW